MNQIDVFGGAAKVESSASEYLKVLPVSVIDIEAQKKRKSEDHNKTSSRANYSPFPNEVSDLCYEYFLKNCSGVVDPFAGWGERASKASEHGVNYIGFDVSPEAIKSAKEKYGCENELADSSCCWVPPHDGMLTCPPYWNLEKYASESGLDRIKTFEDFCLKLLEIFHRFYKKAESGSVYCIMVGDWRKNKIYYDLEFQVSKIFKELGAEVVDKIVVSRKKVSKIKIMLPQAKRMGYSVRVHENLLVFKKP